MVRTLPVLNKADPQNLGVSDQQTVGMETASLSSYRCPSFLHVADRGTDSPGSFNFNVPRCWVIPRGDVLVTVNTLHAAYTIKNNWVNLLYSRMTFDVADTIWYHVVDLLVLKSWRDGQLNLANARHRNKKCASKALPRVLPASPDVFSMTLQWSWASGERRMGVIWQDVGAREFWICWKWDDRDLGIL